jgi:hypothetical protein
VPVQAIKQAFIGISILESNLELVGMASINKLLKIGVWSCKQNFWLHLYDTAVHRADVRTQTREGRRELARKWRVETDWEMKEPKQPKPAWE